MIWFGVGALKRKVGARKLKKTRKERNVNR